MFNERLIDTLKVTIFWLKRIAEKVNPSGEGGGGSDDGGGGSDDGGQDEDTMLNTPLTFEAKSDGTKIYFLSSSAENTCSVDVSTDNGQTWTEFTSEAYNEGNNTPIATLDTGEKVLVRGDNPNGMVYYSDKEGDYMPAGSFYIDGEAFVYGNVMSLLSKDGFSSITEVPDCAFLTLFYDLMRDWTNESSLFSHPTNNILLPATTLGISCYFGMFLSCASLTTAPELPATTLAGSCYGSMFANCASLTTAPELPATTLAEDCYGQMFANCTSLTTAPELPATTLAEDCYGQMFARCTSLNHIKAMFTTEPSVVYTEAWVIGVSATGTFVKNAEATWDVTGVNGIPSGWTVETASS